MNNVVNIQYQTSYLTRCRNYPSEK